MINRAVALKAAVFSPEMICSAVILLTKAPKDATPIAPPTCRAALSTAEATPSLEAERQIERDRRPHLGPMGTVRQVEEEIEAPTDGQCLTI